MDYYFKRDFVAGMSAIKESECPNIIVVEESSETFIENFIG